jgi:hypothetical protein
MIIRAAAGNKKKQASPASIFVLLVGFHRAVFRHHYSFTANFDR